MTCVTRSIFVDILLELVRNVMPTTAHPRLRSSQGIAEHYFQELEPHGRRSPGASAKRHRSILGFELVVFQRPRHNVKWANPFALEIKVLGALQR